MLDQIVIDPDGAAPLVLNITGANPSDMLTVKSISGLTSPKVGLFTGDYAGEGSYYQGRRGEKMTPVITLKMNPQYDTDFEVSDIRELLYRYFYSIPGDAVKVLLKDDRKPDRYFIGYTEDINTDQFSQSRDIQISMVCMDAYIYSEDQVVIVDAAGLSSTPIDYEGSANTGINVTLKINTATSQLNLQRGSQIMRLNRAFAVGEIVTINTVKGQRSIKVGATDIMAALDPISVWLQLDQQDNPLKSYGSVDGDGKAVMTNIAWRAAWWGI